MSERDCPDERMVEWIEKKKQYGYYVLTREELDERIDEAQTDAYAEGRREEREELTRLLGWAHTKLQPFSFSKQEDALMLDEINLILMGAPT